MKKLIIAILFISILTGQAWGACTGSSPTWTCTNDYISINNLLNNATPAGIQPGDTINVSAGTGTVTWTSTLNITFGIQLVGPGLSSLTIVNGVVSNGYLINYAPSNYVTNAAIPFRITGFTFNMNANGPVLDLGIWGKSQNSSFAHQTNIRIYSNRFTNGLNDSVHPPIMDRGGMYGVIDSNTFDNVDAVIAHIPGCDNTWWDNDSFTQGASDALYLEDNTISLVDGTNGSMMCQGEQGGRFVHRYNTITITDTLGWYPLWDLHGNQGGGVTGIYGSFGDEIYGNKITDVNNSGGWISDCRGGKCLNFMNNVNSTQTIGITLFENDCTCVNPTTNFDTPYDQNVHDSYFWGNRYSASGYAGALSPTTAQSGALINCASSCPGEFDSMPQVNREFFADTGTTPYVTCGTLASLPSTCTVGQGYWATSQSCSTLSGMVGVAPTNPIAGTLYKCTSPNIWTASYTPYTYPHPLRGNSSSSGGSSPPSGGSTPPAPPVITTPPVTTASSTVVNRNVMKVSLTCTDTWGPGCMITYYTTNGQNPTTSSTPYFSAFTVKNNMTVKFFSIDKINDMEAVKSYYVR